MISRVDRVSHPFDHPGPYTEERGSCPCLTHVAQRRLVRHTKFRAMSSLHAMNLSTCRLQAQARRRRKQVCNILKHFYKLLNFNIWMYWIWIIEVDIIWSHFFLPFYFCMREMYNPTFVYLKNFVLLYFWIPDSGSRFQIPVPDSGSGFRLLGLPFLALSLSCFISFQSTISCHFRRNSPLRWATWILSSN